MSKTISIFSTKGGVGKTSLGVNLAVSLAQEGKRVILLDFDLQGVGDAATFLNATNLRSGVDFAAQIKHNPSLDPQIFVNHLVENRIDFLPAITKTRHAGSVTADVITNILVPLEKQYDFIIIDTGRAFTETLLTLFGRSNLIILVTTPDALSVYQTKWSLDVLQSLRFPLNMIKIVLNRAESAGGVPKREVGAALPTEIISHIPSEGKLMGEALNKGVPVVINTPRSTVAAAFKNLAKYLIEKNDIYLDYVDLTREAVAEEIEPKISFWQFYGFAEEGAALKEEVLDEISLLKNRIHHKLLDKIDLKRIELDLVDADKAREIREHVEKLVTNIVAEETGTFLSSTEVRKRIIKEIADEALALGPLEDLINDPTITDIMVNGRDYIYIERNGKLEITTKRFITDEQIRHVMDRILSPLGRRIDESQPMVDARLPDGSRFNAVIPPLSLVGPTITIRKFGKYRFNVGDLLKFSSLSEQMNLFLQACVKTRRNMIISGGTGSGKTTVLNVLSTFIPDKERIVTIEDAAELKLAQSHWLRLESRPPNIEGKGAVTIRDLFRNTLRMRPDRIIIGECRGAETLDMLQAMNTGHDGSMTTVHANSTRDVVSRLDSMVLMSGVELPLKAIREMVASAIHIIVHTARLSDGTRKVIQISELSGISEDSHIMLKDIFVFKPTGIGEDGKVLGNYLPTGYVPTHLLEEFKVRGFAIDESFFKPQQ